MEKKDKDNFMPTTVNRRNYGTVNAAGMFFWNADALDTEENITEIIRYGRET